MLTEERYRVILERLQERGVVKLQELVELLEASESTVRRDLIDLEERRLLKRIHGGAALPSQKAPEPGMEEKSFKNIQQKNAVAKLAAQQVQDGESIYLDAGTTTLAMIPFIEASNVTVVTNGLSHIEALVSKRINSYLLGGMMKIRTKAVIGSIALQNMDNFRFDRCFLGTNGVDIEMGYTTPDPEEALIKRRAHQLSATSYVLADSSKIGEVTFAKLLDLSEATLITESLPEAWRKSIAQKTNIIEGS
ncbi:MULTISPECIES: DeoR/GlpR family DNA-binding transcription regulator [Paenibacillus]|jgi:DeoR family fructose operon transcriptional repressor|uniref:Transcriptional regulator, DeoR family n=3 Tax=Paenibacillus TaxID=44249 RepID=G4H836_9BACL|nr:MULTISPECIES: DeoR/GlpR family DNA-binding transcription regulator [Paenibacillus]ANY74770.1 DeoR family transcriptional regulator [Paenibacillus ihbetae]EHB68021.1 transcriptional regulator, DeoR family [Paenibacillus lactis 154]MBP1892230.1 DeoR family fructose operon transcriptional repressor [Paenibacillus lactis]MCM3492977.1 DeoR/GlpR family DNA-binding transcription regulator [Paenibacillus lactis]OOC63060.1 DeoR family transcriptional regulator [Paenibacillus ihbetae]